MREPTTELEATPRGFGPKGLWNIAKKRMLKDRGAVPKEDGRRNLSQQLAAGGCGR